MRVRSTKKAIAKDVARKFSFFRLSVESTAVRILKKFTTRFMPQHLFNARPDAAVRGPSRKNVNPAAPVPFRVSREHGPPVPCEKNAFSHRGVRSCREEVLEEPIRANFSG